MLLGNLVHAIRAISPVAELTIRGVPNSEDVICIIRVSQVVLIETTPALLDVALDEALQKIKTMSRKMQAFAMEDPPKSG